MYAFVFALNSALNVFNSIHKAKIFTKKLEFCFESGRGTGKITFLFLVILLNNFSNFIKVCTINTI